MKSPFICLLIMVALSTSCFADDPPYSNSQGEVVFYTETSYEDPIIVTCTLAGVVFDQDAIWNTAVSAQHGEFNEYTHYGTLNKNNKLTGSTNALTHGIGMIAWESAYENDEAASSSICTGMIGWGKYAFAVGNENEDPDIVFTLNTLDGRWMFNPDESKNKYIFRVERVGSEIELSVYNWNTAQWDQVTFGASITYWENNEGGSRYRDGLDPNSTTPFSLSISQLYPVDCDYGVLDVPLQCSANLYIGSGKTLEIIDYYDDFSSSYKNTIIRFDLSTLGSKTGIIVGFENDPDVITTLNIHGHSDASNNFETVILASIDYSGSVDENDAEWAGIKANGVANSQYATPSSYNISLEHCAILNPYNGIEAKLKSRYSEHYLRVKDCRILHASFCGIITLNSALYLQRTLIENAFIGIKYEGYTFDTSCPNRIEESGVYSSEVHGIQVFGHGRDFASSQEPNRLEISGCSVHNSRKHGMFIYESILSIIYNTINNNGKTNGVETMPNGYDGVWVDGSSVVFHENQAQLNTAYGLQADNASFVQGNYLKYPSPAGSYGILSETNELLYGNNCFHMNDYNVGTSNNSGTNKDWEPMSTIVLGQRPIVSDPLPPIFIGSRNSFSTPNKLLPNSSDYGQMTAEQGSVIWAYKNYWGNTRAGSATAVQQSTDARIHSYFTSIDYDACDRFAPQPPTGGSSTQTYSDEAGMILTRVLLGFTDSAAQRTYGKIDASSSNVDIAIKMLALRSAYIHDDNVVARDTLRKYALKPYDPGVPVDFVSTTALVNLIMAEVLLDNVEGAVQAMDSIIYRTVPDGMRVHYLAKKAEILVTGAGDSSYISVIDSLLVLYPTNNDVITAKYMISQDTTYTIWYEKRCANRAVGSGPSTPIITSFPSPASTSQTVRIERLFRKACGIV